MVYLIHFDAPLADHAQHYIGFCDGGEEVLDARIERHRFERRLKNSHNHWRLCPVCRERHNQVLKERRTA